MHLPSTWVLQLSLIDRVVITMVRIQIYDNLLLKIILFNRSSSSLPSQNRISSTNTRANIIPVPPSVNHPLSRCLLCRSIRRPCSASFIGQSVCRLRDPGRTVLIVHVTKPLCLCLSRPSSAIDLPYGSTSEYSRLIAYFLRKLYLLRIENEVL